MFVSKNFILCSSCFKSEFTNARRSINFAHLAVFFCNMFSGQSAVTAAHTSVRCCRQFGIQTFRENHCFNTLEYASSNKRGRVLTES